MSQFFLTIGLSVLAQVGTPTPQITTPDRPGTSAAQPSTATSIQANTHGSQPQVSTWIRPDEITAIASGISAVVGAATLFSLLLLSRQIKLDHERSRREQAVDLMMFFADNKENITNHEVIFGTRLIYSLTPEQCHSLWDRQTFEVSPKDRSVLELYRNAYSLASKAKGKGLSGTNNSLKLTEGEVHTLRAIATNTLNRLEMIASAWNHHIADREIIQQEFVRVFCPKEGVYVMENFRAVSGIYPSIGKICDFYKEQKHKANTAKPPTA